MNEFPLPGAASRTDPDAPCGVFCLTTLMLAPVGGGVTIHAPGDFLCVPRWQARQLACLRALWPEETDARSGSPPASPTHFHKGHFMDHLIQTTPAMAEPITLEAAKLYLRIDDAAEDSLLLDIIRAAREMTEQATGRSLMPQGWAYTTHDVVEETILGLPKGPVQSVADVATLDESGNETPLPNTDWLVLAGDRLLLKRTPVHRQIRVNYTAGYASASLVPAPLRQAVLTLTAHLYEARALGLAELPTSVATMIAPFRLIRL